jgi:secreted trypsin-like serine protease
MTSLSFIFQAVFISNDFIMSSLAVSLVILSSIACFASSFNLATTQLSDPFVNLIVGGRKTDINQVPWQAALSRKGYYGSFCGGSIIDEYWVVTAAHCVVNSRLVKPKVMLTP